MLMLSSIIADGQRQMERLDHGLVAVKKATGVYVTWRVLGGEMDSAAFNLYRNGTRINEQPIDGASNYFDDNGTEASVYELRRFSRGEEQILNETAGVWENSYIDIPVEPIQGSYTTHTLNDASVGDLDGDGAYEIVVKRIAVDMSEESTDYHYLEAYELDGTRLWSINIGPNIYNDKEFNFLVWDLDGDGKAEIATRTSEGTVDGLGNEIGDIDQDGITNYRYSITYSGFRSEGPDFLSIFNGETGEEITRENYIPLEPLSQWGLPGHDVSQLAHRATKCMFTVAYLDGKTPGVVISRGIYEKVALEAWNYRNGALTKLWHFDSDQPGNGDYAKQGYHNLTQGDVDNDGRDEIVYGSMCVNDDGTGLYSTKLGHGDAQHMTDINPDREGLEYFGCLENSTGGDYRDAGTGEILFYYNIGRDMGRAGCSDITPDYPGMEMWGPTGFPFLSATGDEITGLNSPSSMNFFIWWDGDPIREMLDHIWNEPNGTGTIIKYNNGQNTILLNASGTLSNNWTKGNPSLSADILGDWREEVIWRTADNAALRLYISTAPTDIRMYTLMHDPQYRAAIGWQPNSYNQPPHPGFFIGHDMDSVPPSPMMLEGQKVWQKGTWDLNTTPSWNQGDRIVAFENGDSILFDISGDKSTDVTLDGFLEPSDIRVISPIDYLFSGNGHISGHTNLTKDGKGKLTINTDNDFRGLTRIWDGELCLNGSFENSAVIVKRFAAVSGCGRFNGGISLERFAGLVVDSAGAADTLFVSGDLKLSGENELFMDLSDDPTGTLKTNDLIMVNGDIKLEGDLDIHINLLDGDLSPGAYLLAFAEGDLSADAQDIHLLGLSSIAFTMVLEDGKLFIEVPETRGPSTVVWQGAVDNEWDIFNKQNWLNDGAPDVFVGNDTVVFNDQAIQTDIQIMGIYGISHFLFDASKDISISGNGCFNGDADLVKKGTGTLTLNTLNGYTGATTVEEGVLRIPEPGNAGMASGIGSASSDPSNLVLNGGTLQITAPGILSTNRGITVGENSGGLNIGNGSAALTLNAPVAGPGYLVKEGAGNLILNANSHGGTIIRFGTVMLEDDAANIDGPGDEVVFRGGTLAMYDNSGTYTDNCGWDIIVDAGQQGTLRLDSRSTLTGALRGSGTLNLYAPWIRNELAGDLSQFTGRINVGSDSDGGSFIIGNSKGMPGSSLYLGEDVQALYSKSSDVILEVGELTGHGGSFLGAGGQGTNTITWKIGGKNTDAIFNGVINNAQYKNSGAKAAIIKTGVGKWTLTNASTYTGSTTVEEGTLILSNASGSATGSGNILCKEGANLAGNGSVSGNVIIGNGGALLPGYTGIGSFQIGGNLTLSETSFLMVDADAETKVCDLTRVNGNVLLNGNLMVTKEGTGDYAEGDLFQIFSAEGTITGAFRNIYPLTPGPGLVWDTFALNSYGVLKVDKATGTGKRILPPSVDVYPNPFTDEVFIECGGPLEAEDIMVYSMTGEALAAVREVISENRIRLDFSAYPPGRYMVAINRCVEERDTFILLKID